MIVYYHGSPDKPPVENHIITICPAGHLPKECSEVFWWDDSGEKRKPREWTVKFRYGEAEVEDPIGNYMVATGIAMKTRYTAPSLWTPERVSLQG